MRSHLRTGLRRNSLISGNLLGKTASYRALSRPGSRYFRRFRHLNELAVFPIREFLARDQGNHVAALAKLRIGMSVDLKNAMPRLNFLLPEMADLSVRHGSQRSRHCDRVPAWVGADLKVPRRCVGRLRGFG